MHSISEKKIAINIYTCSAFCCYEHYTIFDIHSSINTTLLNIKTDISYPTWNNFI